ncbi:hypothetical protein ACFQ0T_13090 [Kitasatospora gansuensis]
MTAVAAPTSIAAKKGITTPGAQLTTTASAQPSDWNPDLNTALTGSVLGATLFGGWRLSPWTPVGLRLLVRLTVTSVAG